MRSVRRCLRSLGGGLGIGGRVWWKAWVERVGFVPIWASKHGVVVLRELWPDSIRLRPDYLSIAQR